MAKPNYAYAKRQRDLAKKKKKEEKRLRRLGLTEATDEQTQADGVQQEIKPDLPAEPPPTLR